MILIHFAGSAGFSMLAFLRAQVFNTAVKIGLTCCCCFLRDRFRTCVNVMGDALGSGIVDHLSRDDIKFSELDANEETPLKHNGDALDDEAEEDDPMKMTSV